MSEKMEFRAHDIVLEYIQRHLDKSDDVPNIEIYTVWKCKILQNWKFLISSSLLDGMYYELTFNGDKNEWYLDAYKKFENQVIREDTVNTPQTKHYDYSKSVMENIKCGNGITREIPQNEKEQPMKVGDEVYVHGYIDEIRQDIVIIRNNGGYFGTFSSEVVDQEPCEDLISRQVAIEALKEHRTLYCDNTPETFSKLSYVEKSRVDELDAAIATLVNLPSAQPFTEEQIQTMQELESAQVEKAYELGKADRPTDEEDQLKFYYVESLDDYWVGRRLDNFYYATWHRRFGFIWSHSKYLPWGEHIVDENTLWKEHTYPSEPKEIPFTEWIVGFTKKYFQQEPTTEYSSDVISRQAAMNELKEMQDYISYKIFCAENNPTEYAEDYIRNMEQQSVGIAHAEHRILELPSAQPEIIRCKDCKHLQKWRSEESAKKFGQIYVCVRNVFNCPKPEDFCSHAEAYELGMADRPTGHWIENDNGTFSCSNCQSWIPKEQHHYARHCLYCGARMESDTDGSD